MTRPSTARKRGASVSDWGPVELGNITMGVYVRVLAASNLGPRFSDNEGKIVGFRNGFVYVQRQDGATVGFLPGQLERRLD